MTLLDELLPSYKVGVFGIEGPNPRPVTNWDTFSSIFFATTIVTTIGIDNTLRNKQVPMYYGVDPEMGP